jgi:hypothetical protein
MKNKLDLGEYKWISTFVLVFTTKMKKSGVSRKKVEKKWKTVENRPNSHITVGYERNWQWDIDVIRVQ